MTITCFYQSLKLLLETEKQIPYSPNKSNNINIALVNRSYRFGRNSVSLTQESHSHRLPALRPASEDVRQNSDLQRWVKHLRGNFNVSESCAGHCWSLTYDTQYLRTSSLTWINTALWRSRVISVFVSAANEQCEWYSSTTSSHFTVLSLQGNRSHHAWRWCGPEIKSSEILNQRLCLRAVGTARCA